MANKLNNSSSPYLLQHASNPVDWYPWSDEALKKALDEDKLMLISIGYSACHWCHVMEHESFENFEIAEIMNRSFVCIKVDREERPDIDQVYMSAVQLMTGRGGWPLNCFTLPDGRPVYGGTYFPRDQWKNILLNLSDQFKKDRSKFEDYATQLTEGVQKYEEVEPVNAVVEFDKNILISAVTTWSKNFDEVEGGSNRAPKFPMPSNYLFLTAWYALSKDVNLGDYLRLTLKKMAYGGIYDQVGGGFSRYSVDGLWKVPHFEKMLYDNAQLISLYSNSFRLFKDPLYREIALQSIEFVERELTGNEYNLYSALDADSEGVEGKFYVWTREEFQQIAGDDFNLMAEYFNLNKYGLWEHDNYILLRRDDDKTIASKFQLTGELLNSKVNEFRNKLLIQRSTRIRPGLDDKTLTSWNALMITAYLDAYDAFGDEDLLNRAISTTDFIINKMLKPDGQLNHNYKNGVGNINGYLEDYAFFIFALIKLYQATFEIKWLEYSRDLMNTTISHFSDLATGLFYFTSDTDAPLIARKMEMQDNVIPASNSQMAINLFLLGNYFENSEWTQRSKLMLSHFTKIIQEYPSAYSNWLLLYSYFSEPLNEVVFCGENALQLRKDFVVEYLFPGTIIGGCLTEENIGMTQGRLKKDKTYIYVCKNRTCLLPVETVSEALQVM